jgi:hypothetical protein
LARFGKIPRQAWNSFRKANEGLEINLWITKLVIPLRLGGEMTTRIGLDPRDGTPLYQMDPETLRRAYPRQGEAPGGELFRVGALYGEMVPLHRGDQLPIDGDRPVEVSRIDVTMLRNRFSVHAALDDFKLAARDYVRRTGRQVLRPDQSYENDETPRIRSFDRDGDRVRVKVQRASYEDQIATNLAVDVAGPWFADGGTVRSNFAQPEEGRLPPLEHSVLADTLGVAAVVLTPEGTPLFRVRSGDLAAIQQGALHCTVSGVGKLAPALVAEGRGGFDLLEFGIREEIRTELNLEPGEYDLFPLAFARELPRAGKPQLFFVALSRLPQEELEARSREAPERWEFAPNEFHEFASPGEGGLRLDRFTYEGFAAAMLTAWFQEANPGLAP